MSKHKEVFLEWSGTLEDIILWLNGLTGQQFGNGRIRRIVDWQYVQKLEYNDCSVIARIELEVTHDDA